MANCSACQNGLYSVVAVRLSATCAEIIAAVGWLLSLSMRGGFYFLLWVLLSCLRQQLRRDHGLGDSALIEIFLSLMLQTLCYSTHIANADEDGETFKLATFTPAIVYKTNCIFNFSSNLVIVDIFFMFRELRSNIFR